MKNIISLMKIELAISKREAVYLLLSIGMPTAFYLIFSGLNANTSVQYLRSYLISMTAFSMMSTALFGLPNSLYTDKINNWQKSLKHSPISMVEYYISKFLSLFLEYLLAIVIVFSVGHFVRHVEMPVADWSLSATFLLLGSTVFVVIGLVVSLLPNTKVMTVVSNIIYMILSVLGGLWFPIALFPKWMQTIGKVMPSYRLMDVISTYLDDRVIAWDSVLYLVIFTVIAITFLLQVSKHQSDA